MRMILSLIVRKQTTVDCPGCQGSGYSQKTKATCKICNGTGKVTADI